MMQPSKRTLTLIKLLLIIVCPRLQPIGSSSLEGFWYFTASVDQSSYPPPSYPQSRPLSHTAILCEKPIMLVRVEQATTYFGSNRPITGIPSVDHST
ncbi:hypothetical protein K443DRAFT_275691 [Laccaria amethystina LaAM-08-1]|uniref:Secreted protein n=1 Tax=Laccaria amethystina LaAM-08-1 TaxID=1095629 RepID=A0A0C9XG44_9AGAR|nr:hypothetical protein K443DRAFT_275691 [Laccaria amethystina LaAM-08-1]